MKLHTALTSLTLAGSLCALAPQAHAAAVQGIDSDGRTFFAGTLGSPAEDPDLLSEVTATCPQKGFLFAQAATEFVATETSGAGAQVFIKYSLAKDAFFMDSSSTYNVFFKLPAAIGSISEVRAATPILRVDFCNAGQSVTYRFFAGKGSSNNADFLQFNIPRLVVTFFQKRI